MLLLTKPLLFFFFGNHSYLLFFILKYFCFKPCQFFILLLKPFLQTWLTEFCMFNLPLHWLNFICLLFKFLITINFGLKLIFTDLLNLHKQLLIKLLFFLQLPFPLLCWYLLFQMSQLLILFKNDFSHFSLIPFLNFCLYIIINYSLY